MTTGRRYGLSTGRRIGLLRERAELTEEQFGERLGANRYTVRFWELGRSEPTLDHLERLASVYGVSIEWLLGKADFPINGLKLGFQACFSDDEYRRISQGYAPQEMEQKWAIFLEGDVLHFHRSWTGFCIYQVTFEHHEHQFVATEALADCFFHRGDNHNDVELLHFLIDNLLLGKAVVFPNPPHDRD